MARKKQMTNSLYPPIPPVDPDKNLKQWHVFPDSLPTLAGQNSTGKFTGYQTRYDISQNVGAFVAGQNTMMSDAQTPTLRYGYQLIGTDLGDATPVNRAWVFETRWGDQIELKAFGSSIYYYLWGINGVVSTDYAPLISGFTPGLDFGFANIGLLTDTTTHCNFSNGVDGMYRFNGAYGTVENTSNAAGVIQAININAGSPGSGYSVNDILTITTGDGTAQAQVTSVGRGALSSVTVADGGGRNSWNGNGYVVGDILSVWETSSGGTGQGTQVASVKVTAVTNGAVTGISILNAGLGYSVQNTVVTFGGTGAGCYINITGVVTGGAITGLSLLAPGTTYSVANGQATSGGSGTGAEIDVTTVAQGYIEISTPAIFSTAVSQQYGTNAGNQTLRNAGFYSDFNSGVNKLQILGSGYTYTGMAGAYVTGISSDPTTIPLGTLVIQAPQKEDGVQSGYNLTTQQGNVMSSVAYRLHMAQYTKQDIWNYSNYANPFNFSVAVPYVDGTGNSKEVEYGGGITAFATLNQKVLAFKERGITQLSFTQSSTFNDFPIYNTIVSSDDKSTSLGAINQKSTFATPFGVVFVTPDNRMVLLTSVTANNQPQYFYLSDPVAALFMAGKHDTAAGICVNNRIYYSFKSSPQSPINDIEIQGNMLRQTFDAQGRAIPVLWDTPTVGIFCNDYTAIFDQTTGLSDVHRHSSLNSDSFAVTTTKTDLNNSFTATVRTWAETFGQPFSKKKIDACQIEIKMLPNSIIYATILFDQDGSSGSPVYTLRGSDTQNIVQAPAVYNPFGAAPFGSEMIGSNPQQNQLQRYIYQMEFNPNVEFFNVSLQLSTTTQNSDFELVRFSYRLVEYMPQVPRSFLKNTQ